MSGQVGDILLLADPGRVVQSADELMFSFTNTESIPKDSKTLSGLSFQK